MNTAVAVRHTAEERREEVLHAAVVRFGPTGLHGTSTELIAARRGRLAALPLPPLRHQEGALHGRRGMGLRSHGRAMFREAGEAASDPHDAFKRIGDAYIGPHHATGATWPSSCRPTPPRTTRRSRLSCRRASADWSWRSCATPRPRRDATGSLPRSRHAPQRGRLDGRARRPRPAGRPWCARAASGASRTSHREADAPFFVGAS